MTAEEERIFILQCFQESMEHYRDKRIVLYGLGVNSEYLINHQNGHNIIALMDPVKEGEVFWGLPVISKEQARDVADIIVIVARKDSVPIIYERIMDLEESGIRIVDIAGDRINPNLDNEQIESQSYFQLEYTDLLREITEHEIIMFDIFDTLIMRTILMPHDIFSVVEKVWNDNSRNRKIPFAEWRRLAEKKAYAGYGTPTYEQIYEKFETISGMSAFECRELMKLEYDTERLYVVPRKRIVQALNAARNLGKQIYLISDMYYSTEQLEGLLKKCGIDHYHGIVVSSEAGASKWPNGDLFQKAIEKYDLKNKKILHVGDNDAADIECAQKCGLDTFHVWNARTMLENSYLRSVLVHVRTLEDAIIVGMYMAKVLNDPFALSSEKGKLSINSKRTLGYISYGPLLTSYLHCLIKKYVPQEVDKILFFGRDGYIPERMYQTLLSERKIKNAPKGIYVLSSRRCLAGAAIFNEDDLAAQIKHVNMNMPAGKILESRFGISPREKDPNAPIILKGEQLNDFLFSYKSEIIQESKTERAAYLHYLHSLGIQYEIEKDIIFDSQTAGTSAYYYRKITKTNTGMDCLMLLDVPDYSLYDKELDTSFLGTDSKYLKKTGYIKCLCLNDSILTSPQSQLEKINDDQEPVYVQLRGKRSFEKVADVHMGIEDFLQDYMKYTPYSVMEQAFSTELLDGLVGMLVSNIYVMNILKEEEIFWDEDSFIGKHNKLYFG